MCSREHAQWWDGQVFNAGDGCPFFFILYGTRRGRGKKRGSNSDERIYRLDVFKRGRFGARENSILNLLVLKSYTRWHGEGSGILGKLTR